MLKDSSPKHYLEKRKKSLIKGLVEDIEIY